MRAWRHHETGPPSERKGGEMCRRQRVPFVADRYLRTSTTASLSLSSWLPSTAVCVAKDCSPCRTGLRPPPCRRPRHARWYHRQSPSLPPTDTRQLTHANNRRGLYAPMHHLERLQPTCLFGGQAEGQPSRQRSLVSNGVRVSPIGRNLSRRCAWGGSPKPWPPSTASESGVGCHCRHPLQSGRGAKRGCGRG